MTNDSGQMTVLSPQALELETKSIGQVKSDTSSMTSYLAELFDSQVIKDEGDLTQAANALAQIREYLNRTEEARKKLVGPLNSTLKQINDRFAEMVAPVKKEDSRIKNLMGVYRAEQAQARQTAYEKSLEQSREFFKDGSPIPETVAPVPEDTARQISTQSGKVFFTTVWKWEMVNVKLVPAKYFILDEALISKLVKAGERDIPGIRIFSEQVPVVRGSSANK